MIPPLDVFYPRWLLQWNLLCGLSCLSMVRQSVGVRGGLVLRPHIEQRRALGDPVRRFADPGAEFLDGPADRVHSCPIGPSLLKWGGPLPLVDDRQEPASFGRPRRSTLSS